MGRTEMKYTEEQVSDINSYIADVLANPPDLSSDKSKADELEAFLEQVLVEGELDHAAKESAQRTSRMVAEAEDFAKEFEERQLAGTATGRSLAPAPAAPAATASTGGKVQVYVSMHGCPLLKSMLMPVSATYEEFVQKIEAKLNETDLTIYYQDGDDKVHVDDDDSVELFLSQRDKDKLKLTAIPAELMTTRMARAFGTYAPQSTIGGVPLSSRTLYKQAPMNSARSSPGQWQSTMGSIEYNANGIAASVASSSPRTAHGRRIPCASYERSAALATGRSVEATAGPT